MSLRREPFLSAVIHEAYVDVNEWGYEGGCGYSGGCCVRSVRGIAADLSCRSSVSVLHPTQSNEQHLVLGPGRESEGVIRQLCPPSNE